MKQNSVAVVGAAETTKMGKIPDVSVIGLHADAALNAMRDAGLNPSDIDGVACADLCRRHQRGRLLLHAARPPCGGGDQ